MRKATKRDVIEPVETASVPDASPPKKTKGRAKPTKEPAPIAEVRFPRAAKIKTALNNNNYGVAPPAETTKKPRARGKQMEKSNSAEDIAQKSVTGMKKSSSAEDVTPKVRGPPAKKGKAVAEKATKKPAPKKAATTANAKPKKVKDAVKDEGKEEEAEEGQENSEEEEAPPPPKKTSGKAAAKKTVANNDTKENVPKKPAAAAKKPTRGRGKAAAAAEAEEPEDVAA